MSGKGDKKRRRALDAYARLQRAASLSSARVDQAVNGFGLSASQLGVLDVLAERGPLHQQELARALGRSKAQMTAIIDALEKRQAVRRERHQSDKRFITVHLTNTGQELLVKAAPVRADAIVSLMRELTGEQRSRLARLCRRLIRVLAPDEDDRSGSDDESEPAESDQSRHDQTRDANRRDDPAGSTGETLGAHNDVATDSPSDIRSVSS